MMLSSCLFDVFVLILVRVLWSRMLFFMLVMVLVCFGGSGEVSGRWCFGMGVVVVVVFVVGDDGGFVMVGWVCVGVGFVFVVGSVIFGFVLVLILWKVCMEMLMVGMLVGCLVCLFFFDGVDVFLMGVVVGVMVLLLDFLWWEKRVI